MSSSSSSSSLNDLPLDFKDSGLEVAYSLRKLRSDYSGSCIKIRRSSDNATQNIGFDSNNVVDTNAISSFIGGGSGFIDTWYDQSGNGNNATQSTNSNQPEIIIDNSAKNELPHIDFNGTSHYLDTNSQIISGTTARSMHFIGSADSFVNTNDSIISLYNDGAGTTGDFWLLTPEIGLRVSGSVVWNDDLINSNNFDVLTIHHDASADVSADVTAIKNGTTLSISSSSPAVLDTASNLVSRLGGDNDLNNYYDGAMFELIMYSNETYVSEIDEEQNDFISGVFSSSSSSSESVDCIVGPLGETCFTNDIEILGSSIEIPQGALDTAEFIGMNVTSEEIFLDNQTKVSLPIKLRPNGLKFNSNVTITMKYNPELIPFNKTENDISILIKRDDYITELRNNLLSIDSDFIIFEIDKFSTIQAIINNNTPINEIFNNRNNSLLGGNPHSFVKLLNGQIITYLYYEPDPNTFRSEYYYNTRLNKIFKKIKKSYGYDWQNITQIN